MRSLHQTHQTRCLCCAVSQWPPALWPAGSPCRPGGCAAGRMRGLVAVCSGQPSTILSWCGLQQQGTYGEGDSPSIVDLKDSVQPSPLAAIGQGVSRDSKQPRAAASKFHTLGSPPACVYVCGCLSSCTFFCPAAPRRRAAQLPCS